ncbi:hypothetical protein L7F22_029860 [Adiantum nelumboides]|nr:hypothetical protein [Adiantum nelumboides]
MVSINNKSNRSNSSSDHLSIIFSTFSFLETYVFTGVCLTVTQFDKSSFKVGVAPETLRRTNFHELQVGMGVNCERAMKGDKRFGGHAVQGHVDTTAIIRSIIPTSNALTLTFRLTSSPTLPPPSTFLPLLISKGYITIDGASLTLIDVSPPKGGRIQIGNGDSSSREEISGDEKEIVEFSIMLIKHTQEIID